jgi:hypothetical protein
LARLIIKKFAVIIFCYYVLYKNFRKELFPYSYCGRKAGRGKGDNECYSETKKSQSWGMLPGGRPEKGYLAPEIKIGNETAGDNVRDKLYSPFL